MTPDEAERVAQDVNRYAAEHMEVEISHDINWEGEYEVHLTFCGRNDWEDFKARIRAREDEP